MRHSVSFGSSKAAFGPGHRGAVRYWFCHQRLCEKRFSVFAAISRGSCRCFHRASPTCPHLQIATFSFSKPGLFAARKGDRPNLIAFYGKCSRYPGLRNETSSLTTTMSYCARMHGASLAVLDCYPHPIHNQWIPGKTVARNNQDGLYFHPRRVGMQSPPPRGWCCGTHD
jgi:hypothetical protein